MTTQPQALALADALDQNADLDAAEGGNPAVCKLERDAAAMLRTQQAEIERLNAAVKWEQNRAERIGTHGPGCETWGPAHYECLLRTIERKDALLRQCLEAFETDEFMKKLNAASEIRKELAK